MSWMWIWLGLIAGLIFAAICCIPEGYEAPTDEVKETTRSTISFGELLEDWDLQDHLDELEEEEEK